MSAEKAAALEQKGARVIGDYGSYKLVEVDDATLDSLPAAQDVELRDDYDQILLNAGVIDTSSEHAKSMRGMKKMAAGKSFHIVHFDGPVRPEWYKALEATGVQVVSYIPNNAYLVYGDVAAMSSLQKHITAAPVIRWDGEYLDDYKLHPTVNTVTTAAYTIQLIEDDETNGETLELIRKFQTREPVIRKSLGYVNVVAYVDRKAVNEIVQRPDVLSIQPRIQPKKFDERQNMILAGQVTGTNPTGPGYLAWLASKGFSQEQFTASGFGVDVSDSGLDNGTQSPNHFGLYIDGNITGTSRVVYNRLEGTPSSGSTISGCDGHGNINSHIVAGYVNLTGAPYADTAGYNYGLGVAPFVKVGSSVVFDPGSFTEPDYEDLQSRAYRDGMRISTNSWGASTSAYTTDAQQYDALVRDAQPTGSAVANSGNQEMVILFAAGNDGPTTNSVGSPGTGKNVITVGASENVHPFGGADACGTTDSDANSLHDVAGFSSRGPTDDGRKKPDIMAPGTHVSGGVAQADGQHAPTPGNPLGQALSCFDASGVCAGFNSDFHPAGQQWYTASSGTSHSTPAVAGGTALLRQYFINQGMGAPTPAMTKAYLMNSTRYMTGSGANDSLFSNNQGTGLMDLGMAFDGVPRLLDDQNPANLFTASGQTRTFSGVVGDSTRPFRVTLAWTDAPGSTTGSAWKNNLDLTVTVGGNTYKGNVFSGANSITGGTADSANNVENVFLPAGVEGAYTVTVTATNVNSDGVPNNGTTLDQDFALIAYNSCATATVAPTGVTAAASGDNTIEVNWATNGSPSYNIYRATTPGGPYTRVGTASAAPFVDSGVSGGTTYYYVVRAKECAESPASNEASVTATGVCALPPSFEGLASVTNAAANTCATTLSWSAATPICGGSITYSVYRSTTADFTPSAANRIATGVTGTSFADDQNLASGTAYYYVVRATEVSSATIEDANTARKSAIPTGIITPGTFFDDFDANRPANASAYWVPTAGTGNAATMAIVSGCHYQSATSAYRMGATTTSCGGTYLSSQQHTLVLGGNGSVAAGINGFRISEGGSPQMTFNVWYDFENRYDGAWLVYSTTGASGPWTNVPDAVSATQPYISAGGYDDTLRSSTTTRIWTSANKGANGSLKAVTVNLGALAGKTVWFGFKFYSDSTSNAEGFYVDDVRLPMDSAASCSTHVPPPGPAVAYKVTGLPEAVPIDRAISFSVTAVDSLGLVATGYTGTATFTSTDSAATLPASAAFSAGVASGLSVTFNTLGDQSITAKDAAAPSITGTGSTLVTTASKLAFTAQPSNAVAGATLSPAVTVSVLDKDGNLVTTGAFNVSLAIANNPGSGTLSGTTTATTTAGVATFSNLSIDKVGTGYTLKASGRGFAEATSSAFDISVAAASKLAFVTQPSTTVAGSPITPAVQVTIQDAFGNQTTSTAEVTLSLGTGSPSGSVLSGTTKVAAVGGVATFSDLSINKVGTSHTLVASSGSFTTASSEAFATTPGAPYRAIITQQPSNVLAGSPIDPAVHVSFFDKEGNLATQSTASVTMSLGNNPGGASLSGTTTVSAVEGVATFNDLKVSRPGINYTLLAGTSGIYSDTSVGFDVRAGAASRLVFTSTPADNTAVGSAFTVRVAVQDSAGNIISGATPEVTLSLENAAGATLGGTTTVTASGGVATFSGLSVDKVGTGYALKAEAAGLESAISPAFNVVPNASETGRLVFRGSLSGVAAGASLGPIEVELQDAHGNVLTGSNALVILSLGANPTGGSLLGTASVSAVNGVATFDGLSLRTAGTGYTLVAAAQGFTGATSAAFDVTSGSAVSFSLALPASLPVDQEISISAKAFDAYGNLATSYSGSVKVTSSDAEAVLPSNTVFAQGEISDLKVTFKSLGLKTLTLTDTESATLTGAAQTNVTPASTGGDGNGDGDDNGSCGCGATSGTDASLYMGLFALARYVTVRRRRQAKKAA
ncbi:S8 family serine peptidase [Archangium violaceum]|uniref:S8 family serine peptidase n=1 Tax=Archangium violaceum TaxID=83451 RepID=UPI001EF1246C|nr:S8 family serine peptidase [Archangium violaceum]